VHVGEEGHARPGWITSRRGQDSPWKSQSEWQRTGTIGESMSMVWPTLGSRTAKEQNRTEQSTTRQHFWNIFLVRGIIISFHNFTFTFRRTATTVCMANSYNNTRTATAYDVRLTVLARRQHVALCRPAVISSADCHAELWTADHSQPSVHSLADSQSPPTHSSSSATCAHIATGKAKPIQDLGADTRTRLPDSDAGHRWPEVAPYLCLDWAEAERCW